MLPEEFLSEHDHGLRIRTQQMRDLVRCFMALERDAELTVRAFFTQQHTLDDAMTELIKVIFLEGMTAGWEECNAQLRLRQGLEP